MWRYLENKEKYGSETAAVLFDIFYRFYTNGPCPDLRKYSPYSLNK